MMCEQRIEICQKPAGRVCYVSQRTSRSHIIITKRPAATCHSTPESCCCDTAAAALACDVDANPDVSIAILLAICVLLSAREDNPAPAL
mmetsp:Transcript_26894/g.43238  ORF Transcript_26894/g.43238 Transcript_26894/m.43238 type:complete len:89 (+) Transcript_26894:308-574(+)